MKLVSVVIPCRNEEKFIEKCLDSIIANNNTKYNLEVLVIDGMSEDTTREKIEKYSNNYPFIKFLDNPKKVTPIAMNIGIKGASGDFVLILSSHSEIDQNFIKANVDNLEKYDTDCVGGIMITLSAKKSLVANAIAFAVSHPFGVGNSYFRIGVKEPKYVDTVTFGCYRREVFKRIGYFDEDLIRNQDDEFNLRLIKNGGKVLLVPDIISSYYARDSLVKLCKMYYQYGYFKPLVVQKVGGVLTWRQLIPSIFVGTLSILGMFSFLAQQFLLPFFLVITLYSFASLVFSFSISINKGRKYFLVLPLVFATLHFSYGLGYLKGIFDFILLKKHKKKKIEDVPLTR